MRKNFFKATNPVFNEATFERGLPTALSNSPAMTLNGTIGKSMILLAIVLATAVVGWQYVGATGNTAAIFITMFVALGVAIGTSFKKEWSPYLAPTYAVLEGFFLGGISFLVNEMVAKTSFANAVPMAVGGTLVVFGVMLTLYLTRIIKVTETFKTVVIGATMAIFIVYMGSWILSMFWPGVWGLAIYGSSPIGIIFSVGVIALAAFNLALDFDLIEKGIQGKLPKYFEWFASFALLVTLAWLYFEILRLLMKLANR